MYEYNSYRLPSVEATDQWRLLRSLRLFQYFKEKTSPIGEEESALPSRQCTGSHVPGIDEQIQRIPLQIAPHPTYSSDLAPCNYFLFPNQKKWFGGKRFTIREQLTAETKAYFEGLYKSYYADGLKKLENR